jgi:secreted trypsin-like serine protease
MPFKKLRIYTRTVEYNQWISSVLNDCVTPTTTIETTTVTTQPPRIYSCNHTLTCGCSQSPVVLTPSRIVGGENAFESSWSMIVSLRKNDNDRHLCGGSIISDSYILTAAHCLYGSVTNPPVGVTISVGMTNISDPKQVHRNVDHVYIHPEYIGLVNGYRHDIAVLHLNQSLEIDTNPLLTKSCIHRVDPPLISQEYIQNGTRLSVIGWGTMTSGIADSPIILQQAEVFAIDNNDFICRNAMNDSLTQFCAGLYQGGKG